MTNRQPFQLEEATIDQLHDAITRRRHNLR